MGSNPTTASMTRWLLAVTGAIGLVFGPWFFHLSAPLAVGMFLYGLIVYIGA